MSIQGSLETLAKAFIAFYMGCALIGRSDLPAKVISELRTVAITQAQGGWGCPSVFNPKTACNSYDPKRYR